MNTPDNPLMTTAEADAIERNARIQKEIALSTRQLNSRPLPFVPGPVSQIAKNVIIRHAAHGVRLFVGKNGELLASPAGQLSPEERQHLTRYKQEILDYLQSSETIE